VGNSRHFLCINPRVVARVSDEHNDLGVTRSGDLDGAQRGTALLTAPAAPGQPTGREGMKYILDQLTTTFPDLKVTIEEILQDGNKIIVRSEITGTQRKIFMGFPAKNRTMTIIAIDIHEFKDGKIVRTWHTEDWLTGLHQLGVFEK
jgi:steroid delta-isomerase-like uncharacterized protein